MFKVCLAGNYPAGTLESFKEALPADQFEVIEADTKEKFDAVTDADAVILRILKMPKETFARFTNLKVVIRWGAGYDSVDIEEAGRRGIKVCNTPGANAYAVAELAVDLMLALGRHLTGYFKNVCEGNWDRGAFNATSLNGKIVGLVGGGNIGRQVAQRVKAFGSKVIYYDAFRLPAEMEKKFDLTYVELDELLKKSDVVSLHIPLLDSTRHILDEAKLSLMKPNALLINTARGGLVDDAALVEALKANKLTAAGLDCVENEDSQATKDLCQMENVIITPHVGGTTNDLASAMIPMIVENILEVNAGKPVSHVVNSEFLA